MPSELEKKLAKASTDFRIKTKKDLSKSVTISIVKNGKIEKIRVTKSKIEGALRKISTGPTHLYTKNFLNHFESLSRYLPLCSSPKSFIAAWKIPNEDLDPHIADILSKEGAQFHPLNVFDKKERIFRYNEQGVQLGENKGLLFALRHSKGNYLDDVDSQGYFVYQPPTNVSGFFQYRWSQYLREKFDIPIFVLAIRWFRYKIRDKYNYVFVIAPAEILSKEEQNEVGGNLKSRNDLKNLSKSLGRPLPLKIISREEAYNLFFDLYTLDNEKSKIKNRTRLPKAIKDNWSYTKITKQNSKNGKKLKIWAQKNGLKCPDGSKCNNKKFDSLPLQKIAFGHIISQDWGGAYKFPLEVIHSPDNLYLTCQSCNSALSSNFPNQKLQHKIHSKELTIGDWLRKYPSLLK